MMCADVPEHMSLPSSWTLPIPGQACKMTVLLPSDPEFMEVESNACKTTDGWLKQIVTVSETCWLVCDLLFSVFVLVNAYSRATNELILYSKAACMRRYPIYWRNKLYSISFIPNILIVLSNWCVNELIAAEVNVTKNIIALINTYYVFAFLFYSYFTVLK